MSRNYTVGDESIYNIIPPEVFVKAKPARYVSRYPPDIAPTASTFCTKNTSKPGISNVSGIFHLADVNYSPYGNVSTFGRLDERSRVSPQHYLKRGSGHLPGTGKIERLQVSNIFLQTESYRGLPNAITDSIRHDKTKTKAPLPDLKTSPPVVGLRQRTNYIIQNAVNNILGSPPQPPADKLWTQRVGYGQSPSYLRDRKDQIEREYEQVRRVAELEASENQKQMIMLSPEEIEDLKRGIRTKYDQVNYEYQKIAHLNTLDTLVKRRKKEQSEKILKQLEKDMEKLHKGYIFVDTTK